MTDNRMSGLALIAGQTGLILTLSLHPRAISLAQADQAAHKLIVVHSLALAGLPFMVLGAVGLSRALASSNRLGLVGFVLYGLASAALLSGIVVDGLVMPSILRQMAGGGPSGDLWRALFKYNGFLDMAFVQVSLVASALAIAVWSAAVVRNARLPRGVGIYGLLLGTLAVIALASGALGGEHAISAILLGESSWFLIVGGVLCWVPD